MLKRMTVIALGLVLVATSSTAFARSRRPHHVLLPEQATLVRIMADASLPAPTTASSAASVSPAAPSAAPASLTTPMVAEDLYRPR
jgi:hypothetical protein